MQKDFRALDWEEYIPEPVCEQYPEYATFYQNAWALARAHVKELEGLPQTPYIDEAFDETRIWIWDTCFMSLFCKFAQQRFPSVETLRNFYDVLHGGKDLPKIIERNRSGEPEKVENMYIHHADNPPLFAWAEYENALIHGDKKYIKVLLYNRQALQKHYDWIEGLHEDVVLPNVAKPTNLKNFSNGYKWAGYPSGMDNTPRGRLTERAEKERPDNPDMLWLDAICQQAFSAKCISALFDLVNDRENAEKWQNKFEEKKDLVNRFYWDEIDKFYYDIDCTDNHFLKVATIASYWTMTAGIASEEQASCLLEKVLDDKQFGGEVPLVTLSRMDKDFEPQGRYWRGGLWLPTAYAALKGFSQYGYNKVAHDLAYKIFKHMLKTYQDYEPHTIWEAYAPDFCTPATRPNNEDIVRPDFCGWSALGPISIYLEYVLGFHTINAFENVVEWEKPDCFEGKVGVKNLRFGEIVTDIIAEGNLCYVTTNASYILKINGVEYSVIVGENILDLPN